MVKRRAVAQATSQTVVECLVFVEAFCYPADTNYAIGIPGEALARKHIFKRVSSLAKKNAVSSGARQAVL